MTGGSEGVPGALTGLLEALARVAPLRVPAEYVPALQPGTTIGRFGVERELGRGGFGTVYAALDTALGRRVALKVLHPGAGSSPAHPERLRLEAEAVARLQHPAIVTLFDVGYSDEAAFLVFELLSGETLASRLKKGAFPVAEALRIGLAVAEALDHAHAAGVLHLDLKPANVFLCDGGAVKVLDFGMSRLFGQPSTQSGGTPGYMAPEQGRALGGDQRSDLFSLGILLHELAGGRVGVAAEGGSPSNGRSWPFGGAGSRALRSLVTDLTRLDPQARPPSMGPVVRRLEAMRGARRRRFVAAGAILLSGLIALGMVLVRRDARPGAPLERLQLVLGDGGNTSGLPALDHLPALARLALDDSHRVRLVEPGRLAIAAREAGHAWSRLPGTAEARALAPLLGADGLLVLGAGRDGAGYRLSLRAEVPLGTARFERQVTAASPQGIPQALDALLRDLRLALQETPAEVAGAGRPVSELATPSLAAFAAYEQGLECEQETVVATREGSLQRCARHYQHGTTSRRCPTTPLLGWLTTGSGSSWAASRRRPRRWPAISRRPWPGGTG